ncbi:MAG TPA: DUF3426 domain-containing protein [Gammaproteobacteria bacterium]|nr:DUF3426 domain-containing protein [Gammaproteobacteria bacterium]
MYAQCPHCETVFRVRAEQLRTARGQVRCSRCSTIFDALQTLREDVPASQAVADISPAPVRDPDTVGDLFEEQSLTHNEELSLNEADDKTLRLHEDGPPSEINATTETGAMQSVASDSFDSAKQSIESDTFDTQQATMPKSLFGWLVACLVMGIVLMLQVAHANRQTVLAIDWLTEPVRSSYAMLGIDLPPPQALAELSILDVEIVSHPTLPGVLQLNARLANQAGFAQAWPTLKVRLEDRWGGIVGQRYFKPADYLGESPDTLLPAHENTVISLSLVDPGKTAVGFIVDACFADNARWQCHSQLHQKE